MKKILSFLFLLLFFGCKTEDKKNVSMLNLTDSKKAVKNKIEFRKFLIGDVNNDKIQDTATVIFNQENEYKDVVIQFSSKIPTINFGPSLGVFVKDAKDLNKDESNEILVFSKTNEGWWNYISVWSFQNGKWNQIQKTKAFVSDDKDFENRIIKENYHY